MQSLLKNIKLENELLKKSTVLKIILFQITHLYRGFLQTACQHAVAVRTVSLCSVKQLCCVISKRSLQSCHVIKLYTDFKSHSYKSLHLQLQLLSLSLYYNYYQYNRVVPKYIFLFSRRPLGGVQQQQQSCIFSAPPSRIINISHYTTICPAQSEKLTNIEESFLFCFASVYKLLFL